MYINKAIVVGNITKDLELKSLPNGTKMCAFSVATNRTWKDADGAKQEAVDYHNVVCFGKQSEVLAQWMKKGSQVYVEGRMTTRSWDDKDTKKKMYRTEIISENIQFGSNPSKENSGTKQAVETSGFAEVPNKKVVNNDSGIDYGESINPDDIPF
jgi:single-strand DNA-binding protein